MTTPPPIPGADDVVAWFGYWPSLHDAEIVSISFNATGDSRIVIAAFETLKEVDDKGFFKLAKQCRISLIFQHASDITLESDSGVRQNVILGHRWNVSDGSIQFLWNSAVGLGGSIRARTWRIEIDPGL